ncbi:intraflagellar transport protein 20 homolog [Condylostylus longicornis]|uniref:intraflagellar transport protein 20 homolog n=1 Tax=Condylostylus longicornis TaxID=2530218 RepID=UPI00244DAFB9|nr:intraflagellar transport protein 20 homolog [Condylostylus longicornis]
MADELLKAGLYIDDIYLLRIVDPKIAIERNELRDKCNEYVEKLQSFKILATDFVKTASNYSLDVEKEKIRAISAQNLLKTIFKQRQIQQQSFQSKIQERTLDLDRLKVEYQYLQRIESEQLEIINNYLQTQ